MAHPVGAARQRLRDHLLVAVAVVATSSTSVVRPPAAPRATASCEACRRGVASPRLGCLAGVHLKSVAI